MNQDYDRYFVLFLKLVNNSIEWEKIPEILDRFRNHLNSREELTHALIHHLDYVPKLTRLDLLGDQIGDEGAVALAKGLHHVSNLTFLDLSYNQIGDEGAVALAQGLKHVPNFIYLYLGGNRIGNEGAVALAKGLHHVPNLAFLDLGGNQIEPEGVAALAKGFQHTSKLTSLDLCYNQIGDEGTSALAEGLHHVPNLTNLKLSGNEIKNINILHLSYLLPSTAKISPSLDNWVYQNILSYLLLIHSDFPFCSVLNAWKNRFDPMGNERMMRDFLSW